MLVHPQKSFQMNESPVLYKSILSSQSYLRSFWTYHSEEAHILSILDVKSINTGQINPNKPYKCTHHHSTPTKFGIVTSSPTAFFSTLPCDRSFHTSTQISATTSKSKVEYSPTFNHPPSNLLGFFFFQL